MTKVTMQEAANSWHLEEQVGLLWQELGRQARGPDAFSLLSEAIIALAIVCIVGSVTAI